MNIYGFIYSIAYRLMVAMAVCLLVIGCSGSNQPDVVEDKKEDVVYMRLLLRQESSSYTRANPDGGENGEGREHALSRENRIHNLNLFIYTLKNGNGFNCQAPINVAVKKHIYIANSSEEGFEREDVVDDGVIVTSTFSRLIPIGKYVPDENDWVIVVANAGYITGVNNLADLRDRILESCWKDSSDGPTDFAMSTARTANHGPDGKVIIDGKSGSEENPFECQTTIERSAARIDFWYDKETNLKGSGSDRVMEYNVNTGSGSKVRITNIMPVNLPVAASYVFKHVTGNLTFDNIIVCGDETPYVGVPTNYVVEPSTGFPSRKKFMESTTPEYIKNRSDSFSSANSVAAILDNLETLEYSEAGLSFDNYTILTYANENTHKGVDCFNSKYLTGLAFKARYIPGKVYSSADLSESSLVSLSENADFWRFAPSHSDNDSEISEYLSVYFSTEDAARAYDSAHPEANGIITKYSKGICYYNLWLKHSNYNKNAVPDPAEPFPMQYGIVRNNIYRVGVEFSGPGDPEPTFNGPLNMRPYIFVRKWNLREEEEEIIF